MGQLINYVCVYVYLFLYLSYDSKILISLSVPSVSHYYCYGYHVPVFAIIVILQQQPYKHFHSAGGPEFLGVISNSLYNLQSIGTLYTCSRANFSTLKRNCKHRLDKGERDFTQVPLLQLEAVKIFNFFLSFVNFLKPTNIQTWSTCLFNVKTLFKIRSAKKIVSFKFSSR